MGFDYANAEGEEWYRDVTENTERFPFSFIYDGKEYCGFPTECFKLVKKDRRRMKDKEVITQALQLEQLQVTLETAFYPGYGAAEWTVWFENVGDEDSAVLERPESVMVFEGERPVLKGIMGDWANQYRPYSVELTDMPANFYSDTGRPTHFHFPYFNLEYGRGGVMLAVGWAGTWRAEAFWDGRETVFRAASVNDFHSFLRPGEKIRTALFVRAPYSVRDEAYASNYWRSWFIRCNLPAFDGSGREMVPFSTCFLANDTGYPNSDGSISERYTTWRPSMEKMLAENIRVDFRWFDAGWYAAPDGSSPEREWWGTVGTWELDPVKWPGGTFRESTDFTRENGMKTIMWFEPERVTDPENLVKRHGYKREWAIEEKGRRNITNNIGDPDCFCWTLERVCRILRDNGVEMYREDFNADCAPLWSYGDGIEGENRRGITETKCIMAHYRLWDEIIACTLSYGGCGFVDSCAGGGGRNDLESLRRGVPVLRSDGDRTSTALRLSMTTAFNRWIPFCGAGTREKLGERDARGICDVYTWRASYLPVLNVEAQFVQDPDQDFEILRWGLREWEKVKPYLLKDFYVHTPWHSEKDKKGFTAYSYFDQGAEKGVLFVFRMEDCGPDSVLVQLPYGKEGARYRFLDEDSKETFLEDGDKVRGKGMRLFVPQRRMARLIWVERCDEKQTGGCQL